MTLPNVRVFQLSVTELEELSARLKRVLTEEKGADGKRF
jgi:hypothetical protein